MTQIVSESVLVCHTSLREFVRQCLEGVGLSVDHAGVVADSLVESNLRGIDSHGVARLPHYLSRIRLGSINPRPNLVSSRLGAAVGRLDADHGPGQVAMTRATEDAIVLAKESGAGWVAVENSSHCGALAYYGRQIVNANMVGLLFTHSDSMVVPYAAKHAFCGTNPLCIVVPGSEDESPLCLDMATSIVPWNTVTNAAMERVNIPEDWAVDAGGQPTCDPNEVRAVRPFGGYKGSGLGLMIDILCTFLIGTPCGPDIAPMYGDLSRHRLLGGLVGTIDIGRFRDVATFRASISSLVHRWNAQVASNPAEPVFAPGQPELRTRARRMAEGIPLGVNLVRIFEEIASETSIPWSLNER